jgi:urea transport system permease protein
MPDCARSIALRLRAGWCVLLVCMACAAGPTWADEPSAFDAQGFAEARELLLEERFEAKGRGIDRLVESGHPATVALLRALADGRLYYRKADARLVVAEPADGGYAVADALSGEVLGHAGRRAVRKIAINNPLRGQIKGALAALQLAHPEARVRRAALRELLGDLDAALEPRLAARRDSERDAGVRALLETALTLLALQSETPASRVAAARALAGNLESAVRNRLAQVAADDAEQAVRSAAAHALRASEERVAFYATLETLFFGVSLGSVLVLAAIGLAITFGVMGVINMAHGELIMLGAYTTYVVQRLLPNHVDYSLLVAIPAAFLVSGAFGVAIERGVIRFLYGRPLETLLATFGISLVLQQLVRTVFTPLNRAVETPSWMSGSWEINSVLSLTLNRAYIIVFALLVFAALFAVLRFTRLGLEVRAVTQNRAMARAMGVRSAWIDALTFGLGSGIAGIAGVALSQLTNVGPNLGQAYIIDSFMVVVFGGVGNLWGLLVGGLSLGVANKLLEPWAGAVLAKILLLVLIILFIQKRPRGLFPQKGRAAEA